MHAGSLGLRILGQTTVAEGGAIVSQDKRLFSTTVKEMEWPACHAVSATAERLVSAQVNLITNGMARLTVLIGCSPRPAAIWPLGTGRVMVTVECMTTRSGHEMVYCNVSPHSLAQVRYQVGRGVKRGFQSGLQLLE